MKITRIIDGSVCRHAVNISRSANFLLNSNLPSSASLQCYTNYIWYKRFHHSSLALIHKSIMSNMSGSPLEPGRRKSKRTPVKSNRGRGSRHGADRIAQIPNAGRIYYPDFAAQLAPQPMHHHYAAPQPYRSPNKAQQTPQKTKKDNTKLPTANCEPYWNVGDVSAGLKRGGLIQGSLRVNVKNYKESYITDVGGGRDICINGIDHRNRAFAGDLVAVQLLPESEWRKERAGESIASGAPSSAVNASADGYYQRTGKVVYIIEKKHTRVANGFLQQYRNNSGGFALFSPVDSRIPRLMIPLEECPETFLSRPKDFEKTLFIARVIGWEPNCGFATGQLMRSLGEAGEIEPETEGFLVANSVDYAPFEQKVLSCLPDIETWSVTAEEIAKRKDLRNECIFSIDPATARDLDDALSCKKLDVDCYEVGVHIADVSHFIQQGTALDDVASSRATSVYLTQRVIPMLPSVLCEHLCSLNPGKDRLAYSVIWKIRRDGTVLSEWFGRTVINSCAKLSYDHAQQMIESNSAENLCQEQFPEISGGHSMKKIFNIIHVLHGIAKHLRHARFDSGALRLDQPKLAFGLDSETGMPNGCAVYEYKDSNRLIEEFMLLANMAVARKILRAHPDHAILRNHPPPQATMMKDVAELCEKYSIPFDISDSGSISRSLQHVASLDSPEREHLYPALVMMCTKPFQNARYFCAGALENESAYHHYALNVPIYTHFTSPIRRYPDIMVHRFLTAALDNSVTVNRTIDELQAAAEHCNDKKWNAKRCQELSSDLFLTVYVRECGPLLERGVVVGILSNCVDVLCVRLGLVQRVYTQKLCLAKHEASDNKGRLNMKLFWRRQPEPVNPADIDQKLAALKKKFESRWQASADSVGGKNGHLSDDEESVDLTGTIEQNLTLFSSVDVILSVAKSTPTTLSILLKNPHDEEYTPDVGL